MAVAVKPLLEAVASCAAAPIEVRAIDGVLPGW
jgi:hypothetical protein